MIRVLTFHSETCPDWRVDLIEENLYCYVERGPSQLQRGLDSPMLEQAHERQFAISQLGTQSTGFEVQHSARIQEALRCIDRHFTSHPVDEVCPPTSPHCEYLTDFRGSLHRFDPLPPLEVSDLSGSNPETPPATMEPERPARSPLAMQEILNPAQPSWPSLKRKIPTDLITSMVVDEQSADMSNLPHDLLSEVPLKYLRANHAKREMAGRTRRAIRMRRSRSAVQAESMHNGPDADQFEKEGRLLLNLSQSPGPVGMK